MSAALKSLTLYTRPTTHFLCDVVNTIPPQRELTGVCGMQCICALEALIEEGRGETGVDVVEFNERTGSSWASRILAEKL